MSLIYVIAPLIFVCIVFSAISRYFDRKRRKRLVTELGPRLDSLMARVDRIPSDLVANEFREAQAYFLDSLATLKGKHDFIVNRCPKCQDTLSVRTTSYHGRIFGCPNYPKCRHLIKVADLNPDNFDHLIVE